ncbi:hypothetical protein BLNAU_17880 [Blattamonas nauphoetae]|uniref:Uncharacterized protein n=1 Tax=Blattamonas nauphoetae TaxID=2049346 RepID=A0ABQ9X652_9EUKA|nr:hypothetical protein BLNAU_17880 [Blattamonas nauphoetae]
MDSLKQLRNDCEDFLFKGWGFFINLTFKATIPNKSSFKTIVLDDQSFPDLILNSLKLAHKGFRTSIVITVNNILASFPWMKEQFVTTNLVGRMFETVDFESIDFSESRTLFYLTKIIACILDQIKDDEARFDQYPLFRVSVFEPTKKFITFMFNNLHKLDLDEADTTELGFFLCLIHKHITNRELRSDEHDPVFVSELVKWEIRQMIETENEENFLIVFKSMLTRTSEWKRDGQERQKRREVLLREEGWDDAFELRVVGIEVDTNQGMRSKTIMFRCMSSFNADEL